MNHQDKRSERTSIANTVDEQRDCSDAAGIQSGGARRCRCLRRDKLVVEPCLTRGCEAHDERQGCRDCEIVIKLVDHFYEELDCYLVRHRERRDSIIQTEQTCCGQIVREISFSGARLSLQRPINIALILAHSNQPTWFQLHHSRTVRHHSWECPGFRLQRSNPAEGPNQLVQDNISGYNSDPCEPIVLIMNRKAQSIWKVGSTDIPIPTYNEWTSNEE